jgi:hypothetical protein
MFTFLPKSVLSVNFGRNGFIKSTSDHGEGCQADREEQAVQHADTGNKGDQIVPNV